MKQTEVKAWLSEEVAGLIVSGFHESATKDHRKAARAVIAKTEKTHGAGYWKALGHAEGKTLVEFKAESEVFGTSTADVTAWDRQRQTKT